MDGWWSRERWSALGWALLAVLVFGCPNERDLLTWGIELAIEGPGEVLISYEDQGPQLAVGGMCRRLSCPGCLQIRCACDGNGACVLDQIRPSTSVVLSAAPADGARTLELTCRPEVSLGEGCERLQSGDVRCSGEDGLSTECTARFAPPEGAGFTVTATAGVAVSPGGRTARLDAIVTGGVAPFQFSWAADGVTIRHTDPSSPMATAPLTQRTTFVLNATDSTGAMASDDLTLE